MRTDQGRPVEGVVDRLPERSLAGSPEYGSIVIEREEIVREARQTNEPTSAPVEAVPVDEVADDRVGDVEHPHEVIRVLLGCPESLAPVRLDRPDDAVGIGDATAAVEGIPFQDDATVRDALSDVVRPRSGRLVHPPRVERRSGQDRAEGRHRQASDEVSRVALQADSQAVAAEYLHARDGSGSSRDDGVRAEDLPHEAPAAHKGDLLEPGVAVERVGEALRGHRCACVETERSLQLEGVRPPTVRDGEAPHDLASDARPAGGRVLQRVEQLRAGREQQRPRPSRASGEGRVDVVGIASPHQPERASAPRLRVRASEGGGDEQGDTCAEGQQREPESPAHRPIVDQSARKTESCS